MQDDRKLYAQNDGEFEPEPDDYLEEVEDGFGEDEEEEEVRISVSSDDDDIEDLDDEKPEAFEVPAIIAEEVVEVVSAQPAKKAPAKKAGKKAPAKKAGDRKSTRLSSS